MLVVDFGAQYAQLIARRVREANVYSEIVPHTMPVAEMLARRPAAVILSGGPSSVYAEGAPSVDGSLFAAGVPVLGICYGFQAMALSLGGDVARTGLREYGGTVASVQPEGSTLFDGQATEQSVWMSHGDSVHRAPEGFRVTGESAGSPVAAFEDDERRLYGVQWHPEVVHIGVRAAGAGELPDPRRADRARTGPRRASSRTWSRRCARRSATPG